MLDCPGHQCDSRAHSISGVSALYDFLHSWQTSKVLEAAMWRSYSVFSLFHFEDIQYVSKSHHSLGSLVSAGDVFHSNYN